MPGHGHRSTGPDGAGRPMADRPITLAQKERIHGALLGIRSMQYPATRDLYVAEMQRELGEELVVQRFPDARHDAWSILTACEQHPEGLRSLVRVVRSIGGPNRFAEDLERAVEAVERDGTRTEDPGPRPAQVLARHQRQTLVELIGAIGSHETATVLQRVLHPTDAGVVESGAQPAMLVRRAEMIAAGDDALLKILTFVDELAHGVAAGHGIEAHRWISAVAGGFGFSDVEIRGICAKTKGRRAPGLPLLSDSSNVPLRTGTQRDNLSESPGIALDPGDVVVTAALAAPPQLKQESARLIWGQVPIRNPDFTGRERLIEQLRAELTAVSKVSVLPQALHGFGGVGKTQLAIEYVYRYADEYDLVWWVSAEQPQVIRQSLATLGERLRLPPSQDMQHTAVTVLDALGASPLRWLVVYDNADEPDDLTPLLPTAGGHVIVTSRNQAWATVSVGNAIEVDVFERDESVELLRKRSQDLSVQDADALSEKLGDLPLALDQAATWRAATGMPVAQYLELFEGHAKELMDEGKPASYPTTVYAFLRVAVERLRERAPVAAQLVELFAFLGAEPLSSNLLRIGRATGISEPLASALREPITLSRAIRELRRFGLAKVDPGGTRIQVHRLVQRVLREELRESSRNQALCNVRRLLAAADPHDPLDPRNRASYQEIGPHVLAADLVHADDLEARRVVLDQARFLYAIGDYESSRRLSRLAFDAWVQPAAEGGLGPDHEFTLVAQLRLANALRIHGDNKRARALDEDVYDRLRRLPGFGEEHEHTLLTASSVALDLRVAGEYAAARELDEVNLQRHVRVFGEEDQSTLNMRNNLAVNLRMLGDFQGAYDIDREVAAQWQLTVGGNDSRTLFSISNLARDLYGLGRYAEALELQRQALPPAIAQLGERHNEVLLASRTLAIALRKTGLHQEATRQARENYLRYHARFGVDHEHSLAATMSYANCLAATGDLAQAYNLATETVERYRSVFSGKHPLTLVAQVNLGIILRRLGALPRAYELDNETFQAMQEVLGREHPYTLCATTGLSNDLAFQQKLEDARALSEETLRMSRRVRGPRHPHTLACAINAAFDFQALNEKEVGQELFDSSLADLRAVLGDNHPDVLDANRGVRAECDIEPPPT
jgi:tetratricopeptide (TPR) repeat protein